MVTSEDFPHLLIYGPSGAGKKTRIMCTLRELYGPGVEKLRIERQQFETPSKKTIEMTILTSNYHIEVNASDAGYYDRIVIQEMIKNIAQTNQLDSHTQKSFKVVVLTEVDKLTKDAQHALRRTMEKYMSTCRLILCCNSTSRVIPAVRSRCLCLRVPAPTNDQISTILKQTCKSEGLTLPTELANRVSIKANRNLRRALLACEATYVAHYPFTNDQEINEPDWELFLKETARLISQQQSVERVMIIRDRLYELLCHCIPTDIIFKVRLLFSIRV
jgi:replication factor C subunit 3/5